MSSCFTLKNPKQITEIVLDNKLISFEDIVAVARYNSTVYFSDEYINRVNNSKQLVEKFVEEKRAIYGVTTGFGKNLNIVISPEDAKHLQENLVRSHSTAVGEPLNIETSRALLFMILIDSGSGYSGVSLDTLTLIKDLLNEGITPYAPSEGSIGSLNIEAHIAMVLIGEGLAYVNGKLLKGDEALNIKHLKPVQLSYKEGLSITSGSTSACAFASLAIYDLIIATKNLELGTSLTFEALQGNINGFDHRIHNLKIHNKQTTTATLFRNLLEGSEIMDKCNNNNIQDAIPLRAVAQVHGSAKEVILDAVRILNEEINSITDNPIIIPNEDYSDGEGLMCANFDSSHITLYCDSAALGACMLAKIADKRIDRLNTKDVSGLPPFLSKYKPGLNNGYMILQYTVAGLFGEISNMCNPVSTLSISTCANHETPVTMATFAAKKLYKIASKLQYMAALELIMATQGVELRLPLKPSKVNQKIIDIIRLDVEQLKEDRYYYNDIQNVLKLVKEAVLIEEVENIIGEIMM